MEPQQQQQPTEPPPIDPAQPVWVQQERRVMFDVMQILHVLMTLATMLTVLLQAGGVIKDIVVASNSTAS
ncbi:MAG: hypothetical protein WC121_13965 [Candidatus Kapaibacterium sp.]|jgi:hypothetical protein